MDYEDEWDDWSAWDPSYVHQGYYAGWDDDDYVYYEENFEDAPAENEVKNEEETSKTDKEAMVQQTWSQAHRSTMMARKDRGFGKGKPSSQTEGCYICGHPGHFSRQCPDRFAPKGKGKSMNYVWNEEDDWSYAAALAPFKGGKSKGKFGGGN